MRDSVSEMTRFHFDVLGEFAQLAADGKFEVPVARVFALDDWRKALELSQGQDARGKVMIAIKKEDVNT